MIANGYNQQYEDINKQVENSSEVQKKALFNNPGISSLLMESNKHLNDIHKMLEHHRLKSFPPQPTDINELSLSNLIQDSNSPHIKPIDESLNLDFGLIETISKEKSEFHNRDTNNDHTELENQVHLIQEFEKNQALILKPNSRGKSGERSLFNEIKDNFGENQIPKKVNSRIPLFILNIENRKQRKSQQIKNKNEHYSSNSKAIIIP